MEAPDLRAGVEDASDPYGTIARRVAAYDSPAMNLVLHSGAGALAPSIWSVTKRRTRMVFLDALMPHPGLSWLQTSPKDMEERLLAASVDGRLPPWPHWLLKGALDQLIPDRRLRVAISEEARAVPLSYVKMKAPDAPGWERSAVCRYVQLSDAYADQARMAALFGFPVDLFDGNHFSMVSAAPVVADLLIASLAHTG